MKRNLSKIDRRYLQFKMKQIRDAEAKGNHSKANRHGRELVQYFNIGNDELPIEAELEELE